MRVTIIADASVCPDTGAGAYAFWAVSDRGSHAGDGVFKTAVKKSHIAELMAVVNAVYISLRLGIALSCDDVMVQTDCMNAIDYLMRRVKHPSLECAAIVNAFSDIVKKNDLNVEFRHVPGHRGHLAGAAARSVAQRNADIRARRLMRAARDGKK